MKLEVLNDPETVAKRAATVIAEEARQAIDGRGAFVLAVSGGHTPWKMLRALADMAIPWQAVHIFQVDERVASAGHADRNVTHLRESLASAPIRPERIYTMPVDSPEPEAAADCYANLLRSLAGAPPVIDMVHLSLGPDGHTGSLVPGDPVLDVDRLDVALSGPYQGRRRIDLPGPQSCSQHTLGGHRRGQSPVLSRVLAGDRAIPAGRVRRRAATVLGDREAAPNCQAVTEGGVLCA